jgi:hypothetical protein
MGLFGSKKIYVSSSIYNLAGDELDRPNFLKSSLFAAVMNPYDAYLGETIVGNYLTGPGIMQRSFFNWSVRNDIAGLPTLDVSNATTIDPLLIQPLVPVPSTPAGQVIQVQTAVLTDGDYGLWAEQWILENDPSVIDTDWVSDYDEDTNEITIQFEGGGTTVFNPVGFNKNNKYIVAKYSSVVPSASEPLEVGTKILSVSSTPSTTGYVLDSTVNTGVVNYNLDQIVEVTKSYSDGSSGTFTSSAQNVNQGFNSLLNTWNRTDYVGSTSGGDDVSNIEKWLYIWERREIYNNTVGTTVVTTNLNTPSLGVTETVSTKTKGDWLRPIYDHQLDTQETIEDNVILNGVWIYQIGTGQVTLDALVDEEANEPSPDYYPFIPIRLNNVGLRESMFDDLYAESKRAYKRATGGPIKGNNIDKILDEVEANEDIGDIDYSYVQWGVSVNVFDPACRRYMYEWFKNQIPYQNTSPSTMTDLTNSVTNYEADMATYTEWLEAQGDNGGGPFGALFGEPRPPKPTISEPPSTTVRLVADHPQLGGFDNRFTWVNITETSHNGLGKTGAVPGDIWWDTGGTLSWSVQTGSTGRDGDFLSMFTVNTLDEMLLFKQTGVNTYSKMSIWGMVHENFIYGGKAVRTTLAEGVADTAESVFIVPLHAPTVKTLGVKDFTQMALSNTFITFNSYKVVKKKWYQTFLGMLLIVISIVVIAALIAPAAVGGASGVFGTNAAVGGALGLTGTGAIVAGAVTNAIAAVVIAQAVGVASVAIFGEKWGAIIGAIVNFAISFGVANGFSNLTLSNMMNPQTLLQFSSALANGYQGFVMAEIGEINALMEENKDAYEKAIKDINDLMRSMGLTDDLIFNQMSLTDSVKGNGSKQVSGTYLPETLDQFIGRTTMTGSDVVDITLSMVTDYAELQRTLPKS